MSYQYIIYGLRVESERTLPMVPLAANSAADVYISWTETKPLLVPTDPLPSAIFLPTTQDAIVFVPGVARYHIKPGNEIIVEPDPNTDNDSVALFLSETVLPIILYHRGFLPLHASAVVVSSEAILFAGAHDIGKSVLAAAMYRRGYGVVGDEVCSVDCSFDGVVYLVPDHPHLKLWQDALKALDLQAENRLRPKLMKYYLPSLNPTRGEKIPIKRIYFLSQARELATRQVKGLDGIQILPRAVHYPSMLSEHMNLLLRLAAIVDVIEVSYPHEWGVLDTLADLIELSWRE